MLKVGDTAPNFTAPTFVGEAINNQFSLSDVLTDKTVVLAFYPLDFTSG